MSAPWHHGAAAVATLTFDVDAETPVLAEGRHHADNLMTMSHQAYGPEVGVPRILDLLDDLGVGATFFIPGWVAEHRPHLAASVVERGHEVAHHSYSHRSPAGMTAAEERADFERALAVFDAQGITVAGHRAAMWGATWQTPALVAEYGLSYDSSLMGDDRPYRIATPAGDIVELPVHWSLDDWEQYAYLPEPHIGSVIESPVKVEQMWRAELDGMRHYRSLFNVCMHPFLSGRPGRMLALRRFIEYALECGDVTFARCGDVAAAVRRDPDLAPRTLVPPTVDADTYPV
ncbi:polysaccharide deacetylase family protein [Mycolicibacterium smegmatis]|uniref:polysaccharide deacetylase family protein n=1 Tax=Mycolicibacterium smegmatis TaxID=1772 RepID=UPI001E63219F|nr:polysaccharide deacetylase [Mycolicibacterium smegmatis]MCP2623130.1 polysaccharide deacetylase [Mycolicibacterium smegmatis]UGU32152.1 polysaccharide deacetylase [Mycolicibacterium smegmatis]ULN37872.1 polysaccharide deacetylase [Mycolicibacterium smegmatis]